MAEKELRRMSRPELIEIIYALKSNEESLQKKNAHLEEQLNDRTIQISEAGSIAEAALQLNMAVFGRQHWKNTFLSLRCPSRSKLWKPSLG